MVKPWWRFVPDTGAAQPSVNLRRRIDEIGRSVDWNQFEKYLRWLDPRAEYTAGHPPVMLFRALLIQQWFVLTTIEYEFCLNDSMSCRRFVGIRGDQPAPSHLVIANFRRLLVERGVAAEVYAELERQLDALGLRDIAGHSMAPAGPADLKPVQPSPEEPPLRVVQPLGPPEWTEIEAAFLSYWDGIRKDRPMPTLGDVKMHHIPEIRSHVILLRVLGDASSDFRYEFVGDEVTRGNEGDPTGSTVNEKALHNVRAYGHGGLQNDLLATYSGAVKRRRPVSSSTYFVNVGLRKSEIWVTVAPLSKNGEPEKIEMLVGVALIKPILLN